MTLIRISPERYLPISCIEICAMFEKLLMTWAKNEWDFAIEILDVRLYRHNDFWQLVLSTLGISLMINVTEGGLRK